MSKRDIRIEEVTNGYVIRNWKPCEGDNFYNDNDETVASNKGEVLSLVSSWLEGTDNLEIKKDESN